MWIAEAGSKAQVHPVRGQLPITGSSFEERAIGAPSATISVAQQEENFIKVRRTFAIALVALLSTLTGFAQLLLPKVLSDHMVIQRELPIHVWGMAMPGETISVRFRGETATTQASDLGRWSLYLRPAAAGGPYEMTVKGNGPEEKAVDEERSG